MAANQMVLVRVTRNSSLKGVNYDINIYDDATNKLLGAVGNGGMASVRTTFGSVLRFQHRAGGVGKTLVNVSEQFPSGESAPLVEGPPAVNLSVEFVPMGGPRVSNLDAGGMYTGKFMCCTIS